MTKVFYSLYYAPEADLLYFTKRPTKKDIQNLAKKRDWGSKEKNITPGFKPEGVFINKEKFQK